MSDSSSWSFSLNREDILKRKAERDRMAEQIAELQQKVDDVDRWLEAISLILPPAFKASLASALPASEGNETRSVWRRGVESVVGAATRGLLPKEIAQGIREGDDEAAKERLSRNPNGLYAALDRMIDDAKIVRHGDRFYTVALFEALSASGELDDEPDANGPKGVNSFIVDAVRQNGALPPKTIIEMLRGSQDFGEKQRNNPQYGYSAIQRAVRQGWIEKNSVGRYQIVSKKNEPSDVPASNGSDAGSDEDGRPRALRLV